MPKGRPRLGILYDEAAKYSPSNIEAIELFRESAFNHGLHPMMLLKDDIEYLDQCSGLFIRDTTHPNNYTYQFATRAEQLKIPCIDSSINIMRGCNKIWQWECFKKYNIPHLNTQLIFPHANIELDYPCVLKIPDSCFSQGVFLVNNKYELLKLLKSNSEINTQLLMQPYMPTEFDWRICIFKRKILFVVKYYMADDDWKIIKYDRQGGYINGRHEAITNLSLPIYHAANQCLQFLDNGLYGIDIKEINHQPYVIEINDNPSIDHGIEDTIKEDKVYDTIIRSFT